MSSIIKVGKVQSSTGNDAITVADSGAITASGTLTTTGAITASGGIANAGTITAGTLGSSVVFPAGTVLQMLTHRTVSNQGNTGSSTSYYVQSNGGIGTGSSSPWGSITTKKANSTLIFFLTTFAQCAVGTVSGNFADFETYIRYSTNSDLSSPSDTANLARVYEDARSTNGVSGQQKDCASGSITVTTSYASGTTVYYTAKIVTAWMNISDSTQLQVMEVAT